MSILIDKEITDVKNKIASLKQSCDANVDRALQGEELTKHTNKIELLISNEEKVKQLNMKKDYSIATDTLVIKINTQTKYQVVGRFEDTGDLEWKFAYGFGRETLIVAHKKNLTSDFVVCHLYDSCSKNPMVKSNTTGGWILWDVLKDDPYKYVN